MVTEKTIRQLIQQDHGERKITLSFPTEKIGPERQQNPIRLKNLILKAKKKLTSTGLREDESEKILKPAKELLGQSLFWSDMGYGMVIYLAPDYFEVYKLPYETRELIYLNNQFLITPLLPMISVDGSFSILAVSLSKPRLLRCTRNSVNDITPQNLPAGLDEWLEEKPEHQTRVHTSNIEGVGTIYSGHGATEEDQKEIAGLYLRDVEKEITKDMNKINDPLLLIGLKRNTALYRKANHYVRLLDNEIDHNPDDLSESQLRDKGWAIVREYFLSDLYKSLENYQESSSELVSTDPSEIIPSAVMGKAGSIFITKDLIRWGKYDEQNHKVLYKNTPEDGDVDLMNWLSIKGLETGSKVYVLPREEMPENADVAALFRY